MLKALLRILVILAVAGAIVWFLAPRLISNAANSVISSGNSAVQGLAQFVPPNVSNDVNTAKGSLQVKLDNLQPDTPYTVTLDQGRCGTVLKNLGQVKTDTSGSFYVVFPLAELSSGHNLFVDVRKQGTNGLSVACGQLENNPTSTSQVITSPPQTSSVLGNTSNPSTALPNTGANPGDGQGYANNQYPRKY